LLFPDGSALQDASPEFYIAWAGKAVGARLKRTVSRRPAISFYITSGSVQPSGAMVAGWLSDVPRRHGPDARKGAPFRGCFLDKKDRKGAGVIIDGNSAPWRVGLVPPFPPRPPLKKFLLVFLLLLFARIAASARSVFLDRGGPRELADRRSDQRRAALCPFSGTKLILIARECREMIEDSSAMCVAGCAANLLQASHLTVGSGIPLSAPLRYESRDG
jgi:hypothetical protein